MLSAKDYFYTFLRYTNVSVVVFVLLIDKFLSIYPVPKNSNLELCPNLSIFSCSSKSSTARSSKLGQLIEDDE